MHRGGRGRLSSLCLRWSASGGTLWHWAGGRPVGGMDSQKHSIGCLHGASKFPDGNCFPLGFWLGDGRGRWCFPVPLFPAKLSSVVQGSTTLPPLSSSPPILLEELLAYNLPDVKSRSLSEHTPSGPSAFASQTQGFCLAGGPPLRRRLPPASLWSAHRLSALPTLFRGPLVCAWLQKLCSASLLAVFWVI